MYENKAFADFCGFKKQNGQILALCVILIDFSSLLQHWKLCIQYLRFIRHHYDVKVKIIFYFLFDIKSLTDFLSYYI